MTTQITPQDSRRSPPAVAGQPEGEAEAARSRVGVALGNAWAHCVNTRLVMEFITRELRKVRCCYGNQLSVIFSQVKGI